MQYRIHFIHEGQCFNGMPSISSESLVHRMLLKIWYKSQVIATYTVTATYNIIQFVCLFVRDFSKDC